jgi:hypothetical protein
MKLFKNKKTGKMYVTLSEEKDCLVGFDGVPYTGSSDDVEEVSTTASAQDFRRLHEEANGFSIGCSVNNENKRKYKVGDKFSFSLKNGESVTALAVKEETDGMVFIFEDCLSKAYPMNDNLMDMLNNELYKLFPDKIRDAMVSFDGNSMIRIPTEKEIFGVNKYGEKESDDVKQFEPMKNRRNRIAFRNNEFEWYWLKNRGVRSATHFACVASTGYADYYAASFSFGVRPLFKIRFVEI